MGLVQQLNSSASAVEEDDNRQLAARYELERVCALGRGGAGRPDRFITFGCAKAVSYPTAALNAEFDQILATNER